VRRLSLFALTLMLAFGAASNAGEAVGNLEGTMVDSHGNPVQGATVVIQTSDGQHPHATHTDARGHFEFDRYAAGQYDLRGSFYSVFTDWTRRVLIRAGKTTQITLHLPAAVK
jgi:Carboxypeptidase regulatory-like domain